MKKILFLGLLCSSLTAFTQSAGSLDASFGTGGKVVTSINAGSDKAYSVALQTDQKIVVAGVTDNPATGKDFVCVRYNTDGSLDNTFGTNGIVTTDLQLGSDDVAYSLAIQPDGKIVLGGYSDDGSLKKAALIRYNPNGTVDTNFGTNGRVLTAFEGTQANEIKVVKIHALTGNIVVGGNTVVSSLKAKPVVARYTNTGALDPTFNNTGIRLLWIEPNDDNYFMTIEDLVVQANGKISAVGWRKSIFSGYTNDGWACRINANGTMDPTFSVDGVSEYNDTSTSDNRFSAMFLKPDNSFIVAGGIRRPYDFYLCKISADGAEPNIYNEIGLSFGDLFSDYYYFSYGMKEDITGKYVMAGEKGDNINKAFALARVNPDFTIDSTFNETGNGTVTTTFNDNLLNGAFDVVIQPDNKIVAVGYTGSDFALARYLGTAVVSTNQVYEQNALHVYPNPAENKLNLDTKEEQLLYNQDYQILDARGAVLIQGKFMNNASTIDLSSLSTGAYFLHIKAINSTTKFIKK